MKLESASFRNNEIIPDKFTCNGENVSPQLYWTGQPSKTESFVLIMQDPDAPSAQKPAADPWTHWVVFNLPAHVHKLDVDASIESLEGKQGLNSDNQKKYTGPNPPARSGPHRYFFTIYALEKKLDLHSSATKQQVLDAMKHHVIAQGELMGVYENK